MTAKRKAAPSAVDLALARRKKAPEAAPEPASVQVTVYLSPERIRGLRLLRVDTGRTVSSLVEEAVGEYLDRRGKAGR